MNEEATMAAKVTFAVRGEWEQEPDDEEFVHAELPCCIQRGPLGSLCGYVGVPESHPNYPTRMKDINEYRRTDHVIGNETLKGDPDLPVRLYDESYNDLRVDVHGGLTYSAMGDGHRGRTEGFHWFGFDCAHLGDYYPPTDPKVHEINQKYGHGPGEVYRNWAYVRREVERLAEQLAVMMQPPPYEDWLRAKKAEPRDGSS